MDYSKLAEELLHVMKLFYSAKSQKMINDAMKGEEFVLQYISLSGGEALPGEIGVEMNVSSARIAQALNSIESKGLIVRQIDKKDRRRILITLTEEGKRTAEEHRKQIIELAEKMLQLLGEHDAKEYVRITGKLAEIASSEKLSC